jgi:EmrB/QacA subfamily drug resistance transporter
MTADEVAPRSPYAVLWVTSFGLLLMLVNNTSVNVALPELSMDFHATTSVAGWFLLAYMLANTASILVFGRISDMFGRKRIYLWGMTAFMVASLLAAFAPTAEIFIALRVLQGVAAATIVSNTTAIVADAFPPSKLTHALSINLTAAAVGNTIGPAVGGLLVSTFGWQSVFLVNVPFGVVAAVLGIKTIPDHRCAPTKGRKERFDIAGALLSVAALALILYSLDRMSSHGFGDPLALTVALVGLLLLAAFVLVEFRVRDPLVDMLLFGSVKRSCAYVATFFSSFARAGVTLLVVLHQQMVCGRTAAEAGLVVMVMAVAMMFATPCVGWLSAVFAPTTVLGVGGGLLVGGLIGIAFTPPDASLLLTSLWLVLAGAGIGLFTAPNTAAIMADVPARRRTVANAVRSMLFNTAQAVSTSVCLLLVAMSGIENFAVKTDSPTVTRAFTVAYLICAATAALAVLFSMVRGRGRKVGPLTSAEARANVVAAVPNAAASRTRASGDAA